MTTPNHNEIPYYHTNIDETNQKLLKIFSHLITQYGVISTVNVNGEENETQIKTVKWVDNIIDTTYKLQQFYGEGMVTYGNHFILNVEEKIGDEKEIFVIIFSYKMIDNKYEKIKPTKKYIKRTIKNQKKHDEWWEANKKQSGKFFIAMTNIATDEIAYDNEILLYYMERAEQTITQ